MTALSTTQTNIPNESIDPEASYGERINGLKWMYQSHNVQALLDGEPNSIKPVTVQIATTLRCNHRCPFCNYGNVKGDGPTIYDPQSLNTSTLDMSCESLLKIIDELADNQIKSVIFTGGGEPTLYKGLGDGARRCRERGLKWALNTNGQKLTASLLDELISLEPTYIRVSLNSGSNEIQNWVAGTNDFEQVLTNVEWLARKKHQYNSKTGISIGYVLDAVNACDLNNLIDRLIFIEKELNRDGIVFDLKILVRPAINFENGKYVNPNRIKQVLAYLTQNQRQQAAQAYGQFMQGTEQYPFEIFRQALDSIDDEIIPMLKQEKSDLEINYPRQRFSDLADGNVRKFTLCRSLPWILFIWPDGTVYPCVEWAGTPGFEVGNLERNSLSEILRSDLLQSRYDFINKDVLNSRCPTTCSRHEMNISLSRVANALAKGGKVEMERMIASRTQAAAPDHIDFI